MANKFKVPKFTAPTDAIKPALGTLYDKNGRPYRPRSKTIKEANWWDKFINWLSNAGLQNAMAENPAVMQAAGYYPDKDFKVKYLPSKGSKLLSDNLAVISTVANVAGTPLLSSLTPFARTAGSLMTPSTYVEAIPYAFGYTAPKWMSYGADLAASAYFANEAGKELDKNGLNWKTGINAGLSLIPFTRDKEIITSLGLYLKRDVDAVNRVRRAFKVGKAFNKSINDTKFTNFNIEHVSPNGITNGSTLEIGDEGIHLSKEGSSTSPVISRYLQSQGLTPYTRTGIWTYSNNTSPIRILETGSFMRGMNPTFDNLVDHGETNFAYTNLWENPNEQSFLTMLPNLGLQLSKNISPLRNINWNNPAIKVPEGYVLPDGSITNNIKNDPLELYFNNVVKTPLATVYFHNGRAYALSSGDKQIAAVTPESGKAFGYDFSNKKALSDARDFLLDSREKWIESLPDYLSKAIIRSNGKADYHSDDIMFKPTPAPTYANKLMRNSILSDIDNVYLSDDYVDRFAKARRIDNNTARNWIERDLTKLQSATIPFVFRDDNPDLAGLARRNFYGVNTNADYQYFDDISSTVFHEFGHTLFNNKANNTGRFIKNYTDYLMTKYPPKLSQEGLNLLKVNSEHIDYLSDPNEFRQRIMEGYRYGIQNGLDAEEIYKEFNDAGFKDLKENFDKDYIIKMLGIMLGTTPFVINTNND